MLVHIKESLSLLQFDPPVGHLELTHQMVNYCAAIVHGSGLFIVQFLIHPSTSEVS